MTTEDTRGLDPRAERGCKMVKVLDRRPFAKGPTGRKSPRKRGVRVTITKPIKFRGKKGLADNRPQIGVKEMIRRQRRQPEILQGKLKRGSHSHSGRQSDE